MFAYFDKMPAEPFFNFKKSPSSSARHSSNSGLHTRDNREAFLNLNMAQSES